MSTETDQPLSGGYRRALAEARTIVVKIGTAALTLADSRLDRAFMHDFASVINELVRTGRFVILVSSGAVGAGLVPLGKPKRPTDLTQLQAAAAVGQPLLMSFWREAFSVRNVNVAQMLLSRSDFDSRERYLNIRNCIACLHELGVLPIINENDSIATEEISLGDNDVLAAKLAVAVNADALVILTTVDGVEDDQGRRIEELAGPADAAKFVRAERSALGRGGMHTKLEAARVAGLVGVPTLIMRSRPPHLLAEALAGQPVGTLVAAAESRHVGRRQWIALSATPAGELIVDDGAARALRQRGASLLAKGVKSASGRFKVGDILLIRDEGGAEIGRGLSNLSAEELRLVVGRDSREFAQLLGRRTHEEVIHRDNLALTERA